MYIPIKFYTLDSGSGQHSDSEDDKDTVCSDRDMRGVKREDQEGGEGGQVSERQRQCIAPEYFYI